jgi:hypothetical protein
MRGRTQDIPSRYPLRGLTFARLGGA